MQFKIKILLAVLGFIILGVIAFLLRKKSAPEDDIPIEEPDNNPAGASDDPVEPTPATTPARPLIPKKPVAPEPETEPTPDPEHEPEPQRPTPTTTPAQP